MKAQLSGPAGQVGSLWEEAEGPKLPSLCGVSLGGEGRAWPTRHKGPCSAGLPTGPDTGWAWRAGGKGMAPGLLAPGLLAPN